MLRLSQSKLSQSKLVALATGVVLISGAAFADDDRCTRIEAHGYGPSIGAGKEQAKGWVQGKADAWGSQRTGIVSVNVSELECKKVADGYNCEGEAKVCAVGEHHED